MDTEIRGLCRIDVKWTSGTLDLTRERPKRVPSFMAPTSQQRLVTEVAEKPTLQKAVRESHSRSVEREGGWEETV